MTKISSFELQLEKLHASFVADPGHFGAGVKLLFSCGSRNILPALAEASARGLEARGVGRRHILIEVEDAEPDADWVATTGRGIADYFAAIGGTDPQIGFDRHFD